MFYTPDPKSNCNPFCSPGTSDYKSVASKNPLFNLTTTNTPNLSKQEEVTDRFIPLRMKSIARNLFGLKDSTNEEEKGKIEDENEKQKNYTTMLESELLGRQQANRKGSLDSDSQSQDQNQNNFLRFRTPIKNNLENTHRNNLYHLHPFSTLLNHSSAKKKRQVQKTPYKVLDAPGLIDDFYIDQLHWSKGDIISVCLSDQVYLWNVQTSKVSQLTKMDRFLNAFTSLQFSQEPHILGLGEKNGKIELWDINQSQIVKTYHKQKDRIGQIAWSNPNVFAAGSKDRSIFIYDMRAENQIMELNNVHRQEITGLAWNTDQVTLASGGNDNKAVVWSIEKG